jgi:hypothetical protein
LKLALRPTLLARERRYADPAPRDEATHPQAHRSDCGASVLLLPCARVGNQGGAITLLDGSGLKVAGVPYTAAQAKEGWTIVF